MRVFLLARAALVPFPLFKRRQTAGSVIAFYRIPQNIAQFNIAFNPNENAVNKGTNNNLF